MMQKRQETEVNKLSQNNLFLFTVKGANSMAMSGLGFRKALILALGEQCLLPCTIGLRKQSSHLVRPPFLALKVFGVWIGVC